MQPEMTAQDDVGGTTTGCLIKIKLTLLIVKDAFLHDRGEGKARNAGPG
jgi:hypothetical protein